MHDDPAVSSLRPQSAQPHEISIVIPVFNGELTLAPLVAEIAQLTKPSSSPMGHSWIVKEVLLVFDNGSDKSDATIRALDNQYSFVRPIWLSRNFGQHSATLAGMSSTVSEWIVTMDEDRQHDPRDIGILLDAALRTRSPLVYAKPTNTPPHGWLRNTASRSAKTIMSTLLPDKSALQYQSFRLVLGEIGRSVAAYAGAGVYLDVALGWIVSSVATADVEFRADNSRASGYSLGSLLSHFWRLVLSSGTKALRVVSILGAISALAGFGLGVYFIIERSLGGNLPAGWTSTITVILFSNGVILMAMGIIAEYLGVAVNMAMGKPRYLIVSDPADGPLQRAERADNL